MHSQKRLRGILLFLYNKYIALLRKSQVLILILTLFVARKIKIGYWESRGAGSMEQRAWSMAHGTLLNIFYALLASATRNDQLKEQIRLKAL